MGRKGAGGDRRTDSGEAEKSTNTTQATELPRWCVARYSRSVRRLIGDVLLLDIVGADAVGSIVRSRRKVDVLHRHLATSVASRCAVGRLPDPAVGRPHVVRITRLAIERPE